MIDAEYYDQPATQRVYGSPVYNEAGDLICRCCGKPMARSMDKRGQGLSSCSDTGCPASSFEFIEGSFLSNPHRR